MAFQNLCTEVCHAFDGVGLDGSLGVLDHEHAVLVIGVGKCKGVFRQSVEEHLLGIPVVLEGLVVVEMVACEVGENTSHERQAADAPLMDGMAGTLHEGILAACRSHSGKEIVQLDGVRRGVVGRYFLVVDVVADGGKQTRFVSELAEHII